MSSINKKIGKRKGSKITLKHHKKHVDSSSQALTQEGSSGSLSVRPEEIKMHR